MDQLPSSLLDHLTLFNTSLGVVAVRRLYELGILQDEDLAPIRESFALLRKAVDDANSSNLGETFAELIHTISQILPDLELPESTILEREMH